MTEIDNGLIFPSAGQFDRRVVIEQQSIVKDSYGQPVSEGWTEVITCWAQILPYTGQVSGFSIKPATDTAVAPATINLRYGSGKSISKGMRARNLITGESYSILHVANVNTARRVVQLSCQVAT